LHVDAAHLGPGAKLSGTPKDGPAAQAGMRKGDIVMEIDGVAVRNGAHLQMLVGARMAGGCTSGHGICGTAQRSPASWAAMISFMSTAVVATFVINQI
ncbi:MAG: sulfur transport, partial [Actinomycetota bacterium]